MLATDRRRSHRERPVSGAPDRAVLTASAYAAVLTRRAQQPDDDHDDWRQQPGRTGGHGRPRSVMTGGSRHNVRRGLGRASTATGAGRGNRRQVTIAATGVAVTTGVDPGRGNGRNPASSPRPGARCVLTGGSVTTYGNSAYAVVAHSGGLEQLNGTSISTNGNGSGVSESTANGSEIDATNATISTTGGFGFSIGSGFLRTALQWPVHEFHDRRVVKLTDTRSRPKAYRWTASSLRLAARRRSSAAQSARRERRPSGSSL